MTSWRVNNIVQPLASVGPVELRDDAPVWSGASSAQAHRLRGRDGAGGGRGLPPEHQEAGARLRKVQISTSQIVSNQKTLVETVILCYFFSSFGTARYNIGLLAVIVYTVQPIQVQ